MVAIRLNLIEHESSPGANHYESFGPVTVPSGYTITSIEVCGGIASPSATTTAGVVFENWLQMGIQHGAIGYTPTVPESITTSGTEWLKLQAVPPGPTAIVTLHGTPGSDFSDRYVIDMQWTGQLYTPNGTDVYFSVGRFASPGLSWYFRGTIVVTIG